MALFPLSQHSLVISKRLAKTYTQFILHLLIKVYMFENDFNALCAEVYKHQHIETGGNLFGLWTTSGSAVIRVVLGPGQHCKRTDTSFHQDLEYMGRVGRFVNDNYMLCHIGEWRSHHNLSLSKPSAGDESTIRRNFPQGMSKFLVIIANIRNGDTIKLSPYFFTDGGKRYEIAERVVLDSDSPFSTNADIVAQINEGAEGKEHQRRNYHSGASLGNTENLQNSHWSGNTNPTQMQANQSSTLFGLSISASKPSSSNSLVNANTPDSPSASNSGVNPRPSNSGVDPSPSNSGVDPSPSNPGVDPSPSDSEVNPSPSDSRVNPSASDSGVNPSAPDCNDHQEPMDTDVGDLYPPRDYEESSAGHENVTPASQLGASARNQADPDKNKNSDEETPSERETVLKKIHDHLKHWFGQTDSMFKFEKSKDSPGAIEISFKHNDKYWMVRFPNDFPTNPANLFFSPWPATVRSNECTELGLVKPLKNEVNILLTIKNICGTCKVCKHFTEELLSQPGLNSHSMEKLAVSLNKLARELTNTFHDVTVNVTQPLHTSHAEIKFKHGCWHWIINLPAQSPEIPAKVSYLLYEGSSQKHDTLLCEKHSHGPQDLNTSKLIVKAVRFNCYCEKCVQTQRQ